MPYFLQGATAFQLVNDVGAYSLSQQPPAHNPRKSFSGSFFSYLTDARLSLERHIPTDWFFFFGKLILITYEESKTWSLSSIFFFLMLWFKNQSPGSVLQLPFPEGASPFSWPRMTESQRRGHWANGQMDIREIPGRGTWLSTWAPGWMDLVQVLVLPFNWPCALESSKVK